MKITEIITHPLRMALERPSWTAHEIGTHAELIVFEVRTDEGLVGYGEVQGGPQKTICDLAARFGEVIRGHDPLGHVSTSGTGCFPLRTLGLAAWAVGMVCPRHCHAASAPRPWRPSAA